MDIANSEGDDMRSKDFNIRSRQAAVSSDRQVPQRAVQRRDWCPLHRKLLRRILVASVLRWLVKAITQPSREHFHVWMIDWMNCDQSNVCGGVHPPISGELKVAFPAKVQGLTCVASLAQNFCRLLIAVQWTQWGSIFKEIPEIRWKSWSTVVYFWISKIVQFNNCSKVIGMKYQP